MQYLLGKYINIKSYSELYRSSNMQKVLKNKTMWLPSS